MYILDYSPLKNVWVNTIFTKARPIEKIYRKLAFQEQDVEIQQINLFNVDPLSQRVGKVVLNILVWKTRSQLSSYNKSEDRK